MASINSIREWDKLTQLLHPDSRTEDTTGTRCIYRRGITAVIQVEESQLIRAFTTGLVIGWCAVSNAQAAPQRGTCDADGPDSRFLNREAQAQREKNHDWMTRLRAEIPNAWDRATLSQILVPGSHDAGTFGKTFKKPLGLPDSWGQTQTYSILDQLCQGSRWFDLRFKKVDATFRIFHNTHVFSTADDILQQVTDFVADPAHGGEVVFVRFKVERGDTAEQRSLFQVWANSLRPYVVPNPRDGKPFAQLALSSLAQRPSRAQLGARVFLIDYEPAIAEDDPLRGAFWPYRENQEGTFSDKVFLHAIQTEQAASLRAWETNREESFGLWWTSTGTIGALDVRKNTAGLWPAQTAKQSPLESFFVTNKCRVGNFLIVDFYGDLPLLHSQSNLVLSLVQQYDRATLKNQRPPFCH
jgi:hypothetical protein